VSLLDILKALLSRPSMPPAQPLRLQDIINGERVPNPYPSNPLPPSGGVRG